MNNSIVSNLVALGIRNNLNSATNKISSTLERMSSGLKIIHAKDNASDYVISRRMKSQLSGLDIASDNTMHGINMLNIADDTIENMFNKTTKIRDLALQASNSTASEEERVAIQEQINQLRQEIYREKRMASYNEIKIFEPEEELPYEYEVEYIESQGHQYIDTGYILTSENVEQEITFYNKLKSGSCSLFGSETGSNPKYSGIFWFTSKTRASLYIGEKANAMSFNVNQTDKHTINLKHSDDNTIVNVNGSEYAYNSDTTLQKTRSIYLFANNKTGGYQYTNGLRMCGFKITDNGELVRDYIPVIDKNGVACMYDKVTKELYYNQGSGEFSTEGADIYPPPTSKTITLQVGSEAGKENTIDLTFDFDFGNLQGDVSNIQNAKGLINSSDKFIEKLNSMRSKIGSIMNQLDSTIELQNMNKINLSESKSIIIDADIAKEATNLTQAQILKQISTSLFSQANSINSNLAYRLLGIG